MKTTYLRNKLLEHLTGKTTYTKPSATYIGLLQLDPTVDGAQTSELTGGSYARQAVTWGTAVDGIISNTATINFSVPSAKIKYWAIFDASSNGNMLEYFPLDVPMNVATSLAISAGNLKLREA